MEQQVSLDNNNGKKTQERRKRSSLPHPTEAGMNDIPHNKISSKTPTPMVQLQLTIVTGICVFLLLNIETCVCIQNKDSYRSVSKLACVSVTSTERPVRPLNFKHYGDA